MTLTVQLTLACQAGGSCAVQQVCMPAVDACPWIRQLLLGISMGIAGPSLCGTQLKTLTAIHRR
jgi:hypothetical protein